MTQPASSTSWSEARTWRQANVLGVLRAMRLSPPSRSSQYPCGPEQLRRHRRPLPVPRRPPRRLVGQRALGPPRSPVQGRRARSPSRDRVRDRWPVCRTSARPIARSGLVEHAAGTEHRHHAGHSAFLEHSARTGHALRTGSPATVDRSAGTERHTGCSACTAPSPGLGRGRERDRGATPRSSTSGQHALELDAMDPSPVATRPPVLWRFGAALRRAASNSTQSGVPTGG